MRCTRFYVALAAILALAGKGTVASFTPSVQQVQRRAPIIRPLTRLRMSVGSDEGSIPAEDTDVASAPPKTGVVKWFNTLKGFGFIVPDDGTGDIFVHQTAIQTEGFRSLADGEPVEFKTEVDDSGRIKAVDVTGPNGEDVRGAPFRPSTDFESY